MSRSNVVDEIASRSRAFEAAFQAKDAATLVDAYFVADRHGPVAYSPERAFRGREALLAMFTAQFAQFVEIQLETGDLAIADRLAQEIGRARLIRPDGTTTIGRYVVGWIPAPDGWRAKTDFFADGGSIE